MNPVLWIALVIVVVAVVGAFIWMIYANRRRSAALRDRFGPEYEHVVTERGERGRAERELEARAERVQQLHIHSLAPEQRARYSGEWDQVQAQFVDDPETAIARADRLVTEAMQARGYPMTDFEQQAADISVDHPREVEHYRAAHAIADRASGGTLSTEELRQAMVHYRALFEELIEEGRQPATTDVRS